MYGMETLNVAFLKSLAALQFGSHIADTVSFHREPAYSSLSAEQRKTLSPASQRRREGAKTGFKGVWNRFEAVLQVAVRAIQVWSCV